MNGVSYGYETRDQEILREFSREGVITMSVFCTLAAIGDE